MNRTEPLDLDNLRPTGHLLDAMRRRGVTWAEVLDTVRNAGTVYPSQRDGRPDSVFVRHPLAVVVADDGAVKTVLLTARHHWSDSDCLARPRSTSTVGGAA